MHVFDVFEVFEHSLYVNTVLHKDPQLHTACTLRKSKINNNKSITVAIVSNCTRNVIRIFDIELFNIYCAFRFIF